MQSSDDLRSLFQDAAAKLAAVKEEGGGLIVMTGAGMSVMSGVSVFRSKDGKMTPEFLRFLEGYNEAQRGHRLPEAKDWFDFSVGSMFKCQTAKEAWDYWKWRVARANVMPARDYALLKQLMDYFGKDRCFAVTSNCDSLHLKSGGVSEDNVLEIHGSLAFLQCSEPCCEELFPITPYLPYLAKDDFVPSCPRCKRECLRPNVLVFDDFNFEDTRERVQRENYRRFLKKFETPDSKRRLAVLEIGAGVVVRSIRANADHLGSEGRCLIRVNPSKEDCEFEHRSLREKGVGLATTSEKALEGILQSLGQ
uniref:Deacetylase sirtuin-type domain-containing protein n=1 Tax=Chromera velia CCMP2878 TaxID=1169474 RepID=A0A0G4G3M4_9ALVE|eukprot:Cvel_20116.t1-p1 / transcript=Cvel_20116.t1 / gene=Cvel_20116 / organism=Chromera_velia_CCMP2878 / gene_product=NAD-dependent protein deacylase, putative / transcript_product=NAD-dependent protein deacylase, putative / location=Cvel_scaffold1783:18640-19560(-) / protein_length=307 / sequence_SO=supercontig / SO=protein_coding / is_pseudo=false